MINYSTAELLDWLAHFALPFIRISAMLAVMTVFGARYIPTRVRIYLSLAITLALITHIPQSPQPIALLSINGFILIAQQIVIGVAVGSITQFVMQTFVLLGQIIGMQSSLGFASMVDPANGQNTPLLGQFYLFAATMLFLTTDGHLQILKLIMLSFDSLPIGQSLKTPDFYLIATWFGTIFKVALNMALAGIVALLTVNLSFGVMTRAAPQLNIIALGFSFALLIGLSVNLFLLDGLLSYYIAHWQTGLESICTLINVNCF